MSPELWPTGRRRKRPSRRLRGKVDESVILDRFISRDLPDWVIKAVKLYNDNILGGLVRAEPILDKPQLIGELSLISNAQMDKEFSDFGETDIARKFITSSIPEAMKWSPDEEFTLLGMNDRLQFYYRLCKDAGLLTLDMSKPQEIREAISVQQSFVKKIEDVRDYPQAFSSIQMILVYFPEIEDSDFRSVDELYDYFDGKRKSNRPLPYSLDTLRKTCTKVGLRFRKSKRS